MKEFDKINFETDVNKQFNIDISAEKIWDNYNKHGQHSIKASVDCPDIITDCNIIISSLPKKRELQVTLKNGIITGTYYAKVTFPLTDKDDKTHRYSINLIMNYIKDEHFDGEMKNELTGSYVVNYTPEDYLANLKEKDNGDTLVTKKGLILNLKEFARQLKLVRSVGIRYDLNGGQWENGNEGRSTIVEGHSYVSPQPVKLGYTFLGWKNFSVDHKPSDTERVENSGVNSKYQTILSGSSGSQLALAIWKPVQYKIRYYYGSLEMDSDVTKTKPYTYGVDDSSIISISNDALAESGYELLGSWKIENGPNKEVYSHVKNITPNNVYNLTQTPGNTSNEIKIIAEVKPREYSIDYNINTSEGEEVDNNQEAHKFYYNDTLTLPIPRKNGYKFTGWSLSQGGANKEGNVFTLTNDDLVNYSNTTITLRPNWEKIKYKIILDPAGGIISSKYTNDLILDGDNITSGVQLPIASNDSIQITRKGYDFINWALVDLTDGNLDINSKFTPKDGLDHDVLIEANWKAKNVNLFCSKYIRENKTMGYIYDFTSNNKIPVGSLVQFKKETFGEEEKEVKYVLYIDNIKKEPEIAITNDVGTLDNESEVVGVGVDSKSFIIEDDTTVNFYYTKTAYDGPITYTINHKCNGHTLISEERYVDALNNFVLPAKNDFLISQGFTLITPIVAQQIASGNESIDIEYNKTDATITINDNGLLESSDAGLARIGDTIKLNPMLNDNEHLSIAEKNYPYNENYNRLYSNKFKLIISGYFEDGTYNGYSTKYNVKKITGETQITVFGDITVEVLPQNDKILNLIYHYPKFYNENGDWTQDEGPNLVSILPNKPATLSKKEALGYIEMGFAIYNGVGNEWGKDRSTESIAGALNLYNDKYTRGINSIHLEDIKNKELDNSKNYTTIHVFGIYTLSNEIDSDGIKVRLRVENRRSESNYKLIFWKSDVKDYFEYSYFTGPKNNIFKNNIGKLSNSTNQPIADNINNGDRIFITPYRNFKSSPKGEVKKVILNTLRFRLSKTIENGSNFFEFTFEGEYPSPLVDLPIEAPAANEGTSNGGGNN